MKLSQYNLAIHTDEQNIIFNTYSGALIILSNEEYNNFILFNLGEDQNKQLYDMGFYVNDNINECENIIYNFIKYASSKDFTSFRIYTTDNCNAKCFYCFEQNIKHVDMSCDTMNATISFIKAQSKSSKIIPINWFGGEPLLNIEVIDYFYGYIQKDPYFQNKIIKGTMTTNGSLIDEYLANKIASKWKISKVQITLDGTEDVHNTRKSYGNSMNGFQYTMRAVNYLLASGLKVILRLNYDKKNLNNILALLNQLQPLTEANDLLSVYAYPIFDSSKKMKYCYSPKDLYSVESYMHNKLCGFGMRNNTIPQRHNCSCFARMEKGFVIAPNGDIYKCSMVVGDENQKIGNVYDKSLLMNKNYFSWLPLKFSQRCQKCVLFPLCLGGCVALRMKGKEYCSILKYSIENDIMEYIKRR